MGIINEKLEYLQEIMMYESNKNFVCSSCLLEYDIENKMPKQEEGK